MLSRIPTNTKLKRGIEPGKKKILFVLGFIFVLVVLYGIYNLKKVVPANKEKIPVKVESGDRPMAKQVNVIVETGGGPLNIRADHSEKSEKVGQIPNKTKVEAKEEIDGWYKISYNGIDGWISKKYTTPEAEEKKPVETNTQTFQGSGYTFSYPKDWNIQNYPGLDGSVWIAISNNQLPLEAPKGSYFIPVELRVYPQDKRPQGAFKTDPQTRKEAIKISGVDATRYTYVSQETSTEINTFEFERQGSVYNFQDNGGYLDDINKILESFKFN